MHDAPMASCKATGSVTSLAVSEFIHREKQGRVLYSNVHRVG